MKVYYTCECCRQVYGISHAEGPDGAIELEGICPDCALEIGLDQHKSTIDRHYYS